MAAKGQGQLQGFYLPKLQEKPNIEGYTNQQIDHDTAQAAIHKICVRLYLTEGQQFEQNLQQLQPYFSKGFCYLFRNRCSVMKKMVNCFCQISKMVATSDQEQSHQPRMIYILSLIAQFLKQNPNFRFPFKCRFVTTILYLDLDKLSQSSHKADILAIIAVIYENLSRQNNLFKRYGFQGCQQRLKISILENYYLVQEPFTLQMFNAALKNLSKFGFLVSERELQEYKLQEVLNMAAKRMKLGLCRKTVKIQLTQDPSNIFIKAK